MSDDDVAASSLTNSSLHALDVIVTWHQSKTLTLGPSHLHETMIAATTSSDAFVSLTVGRSANAIDLLVPPVPPAVQAASDLKARWFDFLSDLLVEHLLLFSSAELIAVIVTGHPRLQASHFRFRSCQKLSANHCSSAFCHWGIQTLGRAACRNLRHHCC